MNLSYKTQTMVNLITGFATVGVTFAVGFFLSPFIVRVLGAEANGFMQLANNFVMYATLLTGAFNSMAARFVAVSYHKGNVEEASGYFSSVVFANVVMLLLLLPCAVYVVADLQDIVAINNVDAADVKTLFACVFLHFFISLPMALFSISTFVKNALYYTNVLGMVRSVLNALLLFACFSLLPAKVFYVSAVAVVLSLALMPFYVRLHRRLLPNVRCGTRGFSLTKIKNLFLSGIWNTVNQCGHLLNTGMDLLFANWFVTPYAMGVLAISKTIPSAIMSLTGTLNCNLCPSITQLWAKGNMAAVIHELRWSIKVSAVIVLVPISTFVGIGIQFYSLWQPTIDPMALTILSFLGCMAFIPVAGTQTLWNVFTAANKLRVNSVTFVIAGVVNIAITYFALSRYPQYGIYVIAGCSTTLSIIRNLTVVLPYTSKLLGVKWYAFYPDVLIATICAFVNISISALVSNYVGTRGGWIGFMVVAMVCFLLSATVDSFVIFSRSERKLVYETIKKKIWKK